MAEPTYRASMLPIGTYANPDGTESLGWAVPGMIEEPLNALSRLFGTPSNPGTFTQGPDAPGNADAMRTLLMSMYGGNAMNPAAALPKNAVGMFAGRMAKTADHAALARAEDLAAQGAPREQIWNETGWFQGPDQKWRFEIDDSAAPVNLTPNFNGTRVRANSVGMALDHPSLFAAYPELEALFLTQSGPPRSGAYMRDLKRIDVGPYNPTSDRSVLLHEVQHAIQNNESFAKGASSSDFTYQNSPLFAERRSYESPRDAYRRVSGEVESRNVEKRADMTPEERRATPPWLTQDVPDQDQIVRLLSDTGKPSLMGSAMAGAEAQQPIRAYRGSVHGNQATGAPTIGGHSTFFASSSPEIASTYADLSRLLPPGHGLDSETAGMFSPAVAPVDMNFQNPMTVDAGGAHWNLIPYEGEVTRTDHLARLARDNGHDGLVVQNVRDPRNGGSFVPANTYVAVAPGTVTSPLTGETLFSDGLPSLFGSSLSQPYQDEPRNSLLTY